MDIPNKMKKLKWLLLFWILTLLWIGSSYAWNFIPNYVDYQHNWSNSSFLIKSWTNSPVISFFAPIDWHFVTPFYRSDNGIYVNSNDIFDVSNYSLSNTFTDSYVWNAKFFYNSNWNRFGAVASSNTRCDDWWCYLMPLTSTFGWLVYSDLLQWNEYWLYARVFSNDRKCFDSTWMMFNSSQYCDPDFIQIFTHSNYTITSQWNFYDSNVNWVNYNKWPVGAWIGMGYSFMFADWNQWVNQNGNHYVDWDVYIRSIFYNWSKTYYLDNVLIYKLNNNTYIDYDSTSNYNVIVLWFWDPVTNQYWFNSYPINYSIYSCPYNSTNIWQCFFVDWWTTNEYFNKWFSDSSNARDQVSYFLSKDWSMKLYNQYSSQNNTITFYRYTASADPSSNIRPTSVTLSLTSNWNDLISWIPMPDLWWNWNQSTWINSSSMYYNCLWPYYNTPDWLPPAYCYNSSWELNPQRFQNCFDVIEQVSTWWFISHTFCYIDWFQQEVVLTPEWSWYSVVPWTNTTNILEYLNDWYSTWYFENFLNTTWYFFKCPFPYSESLTVRPKLISMMNWFDINLPINCAFAWYNQWKQVFTFEHSWHLIQWWPLLNFEWDNRKLLYTFFDILIILWLLFFFWKILKFFS